MSTSAETLYHHSLTFYEELEKRAEPNEHGVQVFVGHTTKVMHYLGISTSWYSRIMEVLKTCGCIIVIQRGTVHQTSIIVLRQKPIAEKIAAQDLTSPRHLATLVVALERRIAALEGWRVSQTGNMDVVEAMKNHEARLSQLENQTKRESEVKN